MPIYLKDMSSPPPTLHVNLDAIAANYRALRDAFYGEQVSAVVKADAYGCGMVPVATRLVQEGCTQFFVATLQEALDFRAALPEVPVVFFYGPQNQEEAKICIAQNVTPVLNSPKQMECWQAVTAGNPSFLHFDTAMARMGLTESEYKDIRYDRPELLEVCNVQVVMTHLCNASDPAHDINEVQRARFAAMAMHLPDAKRSLCNSGGIGLGEDWACDLARPGCALYGILPHNSYPIELQNVAKWEAPILQVRTLDRDQPIGYGCTVMREKGARLATVATGYADGMLRGLSNNLSGLCAGVKVPLVGRVTMDMLSFDVSEVPEAQLERTESIMLMWDDQNVNTIAELADTIGYEVLCRIGARVQRVYTGEAA